MNRELWKQVDALLEQALEQPPEEREAFVTRAAGDNAVLRDEVLSLLKAQSQAAQFMERSAMKVAAQALAEDSRLTTVITTLVGQEIGNYQVEKLLGAGGMGEVYLGQRRHARPLGGGDAVVDRSSLMVVIFLFAPASAIPNCCKS